MKDNRIFLNLNQIVNKFSYIGCFLYKKDLSEKTKLAVTTISTIEKGQNEPSYKAVEKIAAALNVSLDYLILGTANKPPEREFSKQQQELLEIMQHMTEPEQEQLLGAVKMYLSTQIHI